MNAVVAHHPEQCMYEVLLSPMQGCVPYNPLSSITDCYEDLHDTDVTRCVGVLQNQLVVVFLNTAKNSPLLSILLVLLVLSVLPASLLCL